MVELGYEPSLGRVMQVFDREGSQGVVWLDNDRSEFLEDP